MSSTKSASVVAWVQADGRLVEDVQHAHQARAHLGRQADALTLPARERGAGPVQREIGESHVRQEAQPFADLLQDTVGDGALGGRELEPVDEARGLVDREPRHVRH
jgi:hypothetical protein